MSVMCVKFTVKCKIMHSKTFIEQGPNSLNLIVCGVCHHLLIYSWKWKVKLQTAFGDWSFSTDFAVRILLRAQSVSIK